MSARSKDAAAMKERLRQMSQGDTPSDGPLPGTGVERAPVTNGTSRPAPPTPPLPVDVPASGVPATAVPPPARWRSQGITVYDSDDERLERLASFFKGRGVRFGRRGQISLLAGAGIAALERLLALDPTALVAIVEGTMRERAGKTAAHPGSRVDNS